MKRVLFGIIAVIGLFTLSESLTCNRCPASLFGKCLLPLTVNCLTNTSVCTTSNATFIGISGFLGFVSQGCIEGSQCNSTTGSILGVPYTVTQTCCSTNSCNPVLANGASYVQLSLTAVLSSALLACIWGQSVY